MTDKITELLHHIRKTNPGMTKERLLEELPKCRYSAAALIVAWQGEKEAESL